MGSFVPAVLLESDVLKAPAKVQRLRILCAWRRSSSCLGVIQEGDLGAQESHGICIHCLPLVRLEMGLERRRS